ncbi:MAG TPA: Ig-like domain-containing protein, partial [Longimicrobiaceae bacterium]|nr:Ig-like domain-containing protein [Longimicrobiaceae bacterium]
MLRPSAVLVAVLGLSGFFALRSTRASEPPGRVLGVLRASPEETAGPGDIVTVTFDRPVAGGLDETVGAATIFSIEPAVPGRVEWRDPVTLRFTPAAPLTPGADYRVRIADTFAAMDGSRLAAPYTFAFHVQRARILTGDPVGPHQRNRFLPPDPRLKVLVSSEADGGTLAAMSRVELGPGCTARGTIRLRLMEQRRLGDDDPQMFAYVGGTGADSAHDLRRVVVLAPVTPLPAGCAADLVVPAGMDSVAGRTLRWQFATYGPLRVLRAGCPASGGCHYGPAEVVFSTPVRGAEVMRHVHLGPGRAFTVRDTAEQSDNWRLEGRLDPRRGYTLTVDPEITDVFGQRLPAQSVTAFRTPGVPPSIIYPHGKMVVERVGFRTLAVQHVNVDTLQVAVATVPRSMEPRFLAHGWGGWDVAWQRLSATATRRRIAVRNRQDVSAVSGIRLTPGDARAPRGGTLLAVRVAGRGVRADDDGAPMALVQVTDLAVHARVGVDEATVWVTGVSDGRARPGVEVTLHDTAGAARASGRTDAGGIAVLRGFRPPAARARRDCGDEGCY